MILNFLELNNFRQFTGKQTLVFSTDPESKATIVIGESGFGKTTLIQCFSWVFYGECKYKSPLNDDIKNSLNPYEKTTVECTIGLTRNGNKLSIRRKQAFQKINTQVKAEPSELIIDEKGSDGLSSQLKGRDADKIIKEIMHKDLFPYFFLEGENLSTVGQQMAKGKSGSNSEFVKAVKGLLGFNYLYEAQDHLALLVRNYQDEIFRNSNDTRLQQILKDIRTADSTIGSCTDRLQHIETELAYNTQQRDKLNEEIIASGDVTDKQKRSNALGLELTALKIKINDQKKRIFSLFSSRSFAYLMIPLVAQAEETLKDANALDKGMPGINDSAVQYMLDHHECICGEKLVEGSAQWETLKQWIGYLPPNNIGYEVKQFKSEATLETDNGKKFLEDFAQARKDLNDSIADFNKKVSEKEGIDQEIKNFPDMTQKKSDEERYNEKIISLNVEKKEKQNEKADAEKAKATAEKEQEDYKITNQHVERLQRYCGYTDSLRKSMYAFCNKRETEKRHELQDAINSIFSDFYKENVSIAVDDQYNVSIKAANAELLEDFTSGGQEVVMALAFIGAIIKLNGIKEKPESRDDEDADMSDEMESEVYPLVMDAPTSNFGMKQMQSFSDIMPKVTNQIIVFINDKDGPILKDLMSPIIGKEWSISKIDTYHADLQEAK
jgi:DNA sulfur modification protein DndD